MPAVTPDRLCRRLVEKDDADDEPQHTQEPPAGCSVEAKRHDIQDLFE
jgi:hypothetical protein